jgi:hypothetical protein
MLIRGNGIGYQHAIESKAGRSGKTIIEAIRS